MTPDGIIFDRRRDVVARRGTFRSTFGSAPLRASALAASKAVVSTRQQDPIRHESETTTPGSTDAKRRSIGLVGYRGRSGVMARVLPHEPCRLRLRRVHGRKGCGVTPLPSGVAVGSCPLHQELAERVIAGFHECHCLGDERRERHSARICELGFARDLDVDPGRQQLEYLDTRVTLLVAQRLYPGRQQGLGAAIGREG